MVATDRRQLIVAMGALIGLPLLHAEALAAQLATLDGKPPFLGQATMTLLAAVADTLIPRTDTPGAVQVGVPAAFDVMMRDWAAPAHRETYLGALGAIDAAALARTGKPLAGLTPAERAVFLSAYDAEQFAAAAADPLDPRAAYLRLRELLVSLYYLSKDGATVELRYEEMPGAWVASMPLAPATRAWAGANVG